MSADTTELAILLSLQDNASPGLRNVGDVLANNRSAIRELASGTAYLGSAFLGMGLAMKSSNVASLQSAGNMLTMVGGMMSAIGTTAHFVSAIAKMTNALKVLNVQQIIANALSPGGWAKLAIGGVVAGGMIYGFSKMSSSSAQNVTLENKTYLDGRVIAQNTRTNIIKLQNRTNSSGIK